MVNTVKLANVISKVIGNVGAPSEDATIPYTLAAVGGNKKPPATGREAGGPKYLNTEMPAFLRQAFY